MVSHPNRSKSRGVNAQRIYDAFIDTPDLGKSSYLHDHYRRGIAGIMEPARANHLAHAAWSAGRDTAAIKVAAPSNRGSSPVRNIGE